MEKKAAVIIGAGASAGVWTGTVPLTNQDLQPPIARQLFDQRFWSFVGRHLGAEVIGAELGPLARNQNEAFDLETRLAQYRNSTDPIIRRHFKDIPPYLRDILLAASRSYVPSPGNYIRLATRLLSEGTHEIMFVVLNYDTMLEQALGKYDAAYTYTAMGDFMDDRRQAKVAKIHGSTSWGHPILGTAPSDGQPVHTWMEALDDFEFPPGLPDSVYVFPSDHPTGEWRAPDTDRLLYPAMTAPVTDKTFCCPLGHWAALKTFLQDCHKFLVIGTSGLDSDLLQLLTDTTTAAPPNVIYYVSDSTTGVSGMRARFEEALPIWSLPGPEAPSPREFTRGFLEFLNTPDSVEDFLAVD